MNIQAWSIANWNRIPEADRKACLDKLRTAMESPDGVQELAQWRAQAKMGITIGSADSGFHFRTGMSVRNILRRALRDDKLPPVEQSGGDSAQNWDDFYLGAIHALATEVQP